MKKQGRLWNSGRMIEILLHCSVVDAQELVGGCHHVDAVGLALGAFPVHELIYRFIGG